MSDPLTALMHAVQVMNLLKTLIIKTLREREEAASEGEYSPMSGCSTCHQDMETSCESRGTAMSDCDENAHYTHSSQESENEDEVQSLDETATSDEEDLYKNMNQLEDNFQDENADPQYSSDIEVGDGNCKMSTSDEEDLYKNIELESPSSSKVSNLQINRLQLAPVSMFESI